MKNHSPLVSARDSVLSTTACLLGTSQLVSFKPHLDNFQKMLGNQYYVVFQAVPKKKSGLQRVKVDTELPNSELLAPDNVWVPAAGAK